MIKEIHESNYHEKYMFNTVEKLFAQKEYPKVYFLLKNNYIDEKNFVVETLSILYSFAKNDFSFFTHYKDTVIPTGRTQAVIFDFDGTLTHGKTNKTTWESLWVNLGYDVKACQELHMQYDRHIITHSQWCKQTQEKFCERKLNKKTLNDISQNIKLIDGIEDTFKRLESLNIKIYIVSGSILYIIKRTLGNLNKYVDEVKANIFKFDSNGFLTEIVGTKYDFEGKAEFISQVASELNISPQDILFVGNSVNDRFAYISGARTLCINPKLTDITNQTVWNDCIPTCENLLEIFDFIKQ